MDKYRYYIFVILFATFVYACKSVSKYAIDEKPGIKIDTNILGIWKAVEDTDRANFVLVQNNYDATHLQEEYKYGSYAIYNNDYFITYMNMHGQNSLYHQFTSFLSKVKGTEFLNVTYSYSPYADHKFTGMTYEGFFFVRLIHINASFDTITTAIVADTTIKNLKSNGEVRRRIAKNLNTASFYSDTLHFYKVSGYHLSSNESKLRANR